MPTAVVCEDDAVLRRTLTAICEQIGFRVVAEVDSGADAVELTRRFGVDLLLLDLGLPDGISGQETLGALQDLSPYPSVVVFTAYAPNPEEILRLGAQEVVEKPNLDQLIVVLERMVNQPDLHRTARHEPGDERRREFRPVGPPPELWRSPSGVSSDADLVHTLAATEPGDTVIVIAVGGLELVDAAIGPMLAADNRLAVARALRQTLRVQDVVHDLEKFDGFVAVLRGGDHTAAAAVWARLLERTSIDGMHGHLSGAYASVTELGGRDALVRAVAAVQASPQSQLLITA